MPVSAITGTSAAAIADSVRTLIASGELRPGDVLPSVRTLAVERGVNRNTVAAGYASLIAAGVVESRRRGGTVVRDVIPIASEGVPAPADTVNLADGNPDPELLPTLPDLSGYTLGLYGAAAIDDRLSSWAEGELRRDGGAGGELVLTHGAVDAVERLLGAHLIRGDAVAVEDPCFLSSIGTFRLNGYRPVPVPVDEHGMTAPALRVALASGARAVVCTPRAHNPTGASLSEQRAAELRAVLADFPDVLVIEDDHFSALAATSYRRITPPGTARWALVRSVSKWCGPDLRLGFTWCDPDTAARLRTRLSAATWVSHVLQHLVAGILTDPATTPLWERASTLYAQRRGLLTDALTTAGVPYLGGQDGINVWIPLPGREQPVVDALARKGWSVRPGAAFALTRRPAIRVTAATLTPDQARAFAADLAGILTP